MTYKLKAMVLVVLIVFFALHCGKKGPLVLAPELSPQQATHLQLTQVGQSIQLQWDFPAQLSGNTKDKDALQMMQDEIRNIYIYYSSTELPGDKFRKKADLLRKLTFSELTPVSTVAPIAPATPTSKVTLPQVKKNYAFFVTLPFSLKNLDNKQHFFAIQYDYRRMKSPLSEIAYIATQIPVKAVEGLTVTRENKMIKLTWKRPEKDVTEKITTTIAGYQVFKKIEADETDPSSSDIDSKKSVPTPIASKKQPKDAVRTSEVQDGKNFIKINPEKILMEYYEDTDTGTNGKYTYYVSAIVSNNIETAPSAHVSIQVVDTFPPEIPANLVCFKAEDHMFLTWQVVADADFSHFRVYRRLTQDGEYDLVADTVATNQYKDKAVTKGKTYYYVVTAVDKKGNESQNSNMAREQF